MSTFPKRNQFTVIIRTFSLAARFPLWPFCPTGGRVLIMIAVILWSSSVSGHTILFDSKTPSASEPVGRVASLRVHRIMTRNVSCRRPYVTKSVKTFLFPQPNVSNVSPVVLQLRQGMITVMSPLFINPRIIKTA